MFEKDTNKTRFCQFAFLTIIVVSISCLYSFVVFAVETDDNYVLDESAKKIEGSQLFDSGTNYSNGSLNELGFSISSTKSSSDVSQLNVVSNDSGMGSTYAINTYVDATTGKITIPDNIVLTNLETENKIKFRGISLDILEGYEKLGGNWEIKLQDGTQIFYGEIGTTVTFDKAIVMDASSSLNLNVTWDRSGIFEKRYIGEMPYQFSFYYDVVMYEPYANYFESGEDNIIAFYYDWDRYDRPGTTYSMPTTTSTDKPWLKENYKTVTKMIVGESFHNYAPTDLDYWFGIAYGSGGITNLTYIDLTYLNTSNCTNFSYMFCMCTDIETIVGLNSMDTSKGINFNGMFKYANVENLNMSDWDLSSAQTCKSMFANTSGNKIPDLSKWDLSSVTSFFMGFAYSNVTDFSGISNWNMKSLKEAGAMFEKCLYATIPPDLSSWEGTSMTRCEHMFMDFGSENGGILFSIRLDKLSFTNCARTYRMFQNCPYLEAIYCNFNVAQDATLLTETLSLDMFRNCINLSPLIESESIPVNKTYAYPKSESDPDGLFTAC